jgi:signal transduction histidine kinase
VTLRVRLLLIILAVTVAGIGFMAVATLQIFEATLKSDLLDGLAARAHELELAFMGAIEPEEIAVAGRGYLVQFDARDGATLLSAPALAGRVIPVDEEARETARSGGLARLGDVSANGIELIAVVGPWPAVPGGTLVVAQSRQVLAEAERRLALVLGISGLAGVLLVGLAAWVLVGRALRPLERIAVEARRIDLNTLPGRVPVPDSHDEVGALARVINEMLERLHRSSRAQLDFLAEASHELGTPITSLRGSLRQAVARIEEGHPARPLVLKADQLALRTARVAKDLLLLGRSEVGPEMDTHLVSVGDLVDSVAAEFPRPVEVNRSAEELLTVGDPERLAQVFRNLIANAMRATEPAGRVWARTLVAGAELKIEIHDDGPGIPPERLARLFERYTSFVPGGTGLGLVIAKRIIEAHGGRIEVDSEPGTGTVARVTLRRADLDESPG